MADVSPSGPDASAAPDGSVDPQAERYLKDRLLPQITWYKARSRRAKRLHQVFGWSGMSMAGAVPLLNTFLHGQPEVGLVSSGMSAAVAFATATTTLGRFQGDWLRYREMATKLTALHQKFLYRVKPFDGDDPLTDLVEIVEDLLSDETTAWGVERRSRAPSAPAPVRPAPVPDRRVRPDPNLE